MKRLRRLVGVTGRVLVGAALIGVSLVFAPVAAQAAASVATGFTAVWGYQHSPTPSRVYSYGILNAGGDNTGSGGDCSYSGANNVFELQPGGSWLISNSKTFAAYWYLTGPGYPDAYATACSAYTSDTPSEWGAQQANWFSEAVAAAGFSPSQVAHAFADVELTGAYWTNTTDDAALIASFEGQLAADGFQNKGLYSDPGEWDDIIGSDNYPNLDTSTFWLGDNTATSLKALNTAEDHWANHGYVIWSWQYTLGDVNCEDNSLSYGQALAASASPAIPQADMWEDPETVCTTDVGIAPGSDDTSYWGVDDNGGVYRLGGAKNEGQVPLVPTITSDISGMASLFDSAGYWVAGKDGSVYAFGNTSYKGNCTASGDSCGETIVGIAPYASCGDTGCDYDGYWLVGSDGGVYTFGTAHFHGSCPQSGSGCQGVTDIVGIAATPDEGGYWLVGADGGVFHFGDASNEGNCTPSGAYCGTTITGMAPDPCSSNNGYWLVGKNGGVFAFGSATFHGSEAGNVDDMVGMAVDGSCGGYWERAANGATWSFGDAVNEGDFDF